MNHPLIDLPEGFEMFHPVKIYEHLVSHVQGMGPRHWDQTLWEYNTNQIVGFHDSVAAGTAQVSEMNECGTACCVAGEVVTMHGLSRINLGAFGGFRDAAEALGVQDEMETMHGHLFDASRTQAQVLAELRHRHTKALADVS